MKSQKTCWIDWGIIFLVVLLTFLQAGVWADSQEKQWVVFQDQISERCARYSITLRYVPSGSTFYKLSQRDVKSVVLSEDEQIDNYKQLIKFDKTVDGYQYSMLLRSADELAVLNNDRTQILMTRILRSKQDVEPEILREGYFFYGRQLEIPFELLGKQLGLPTTESVTGTFSIDIYDRDLSYEGSFSTVLRGSVIGSTFIDNTKLEVSLSHKKSLQIDDWNVDLSVWSLDGRVTLDSAGGGITDVLKLSSAELVVEKIASDNSEIVLAVLRGDIGKAEEEWLKSHLSVGKSIPAFARVDLTRRKLLTLNELCRETGSKRNIVFIFGDFRQQYSECGYRDQAASELTLDETVILEILQRDLKYPPVVVFVCRRFSLSDLYEKWLGRELDFTVVADYSNPMDVQFLVHSSYNQPRHRPYEKMETLREQFGLPENKVSVLLVNGKGNLSYINADASQQLAGDLAEINKLISSGK